MLLLTGLLALLMEYHDDEECDCEEVGTCRCCLTTAALKEAAEVYPVELAAAERAWGRDVEARFTRPRVRLPEGSEVVG
jgi:hypothetical protein